MLDLTTFMSMIGGSLAGPPGAVAGIVIGGVLTNLLPDVGKNILGNLGTEGVQALYQRLWQRQPAQPALNHDLQRAFRAALILALHDIGGRATFGRAYQRPRLPLPDGLRYAFVAHDRKTAARLQDALRKLVRALNEERVLPLAEANSPLSQTTAGLLQGTPDAAPLIAAITTFLLLHNEFAGLMAEQPGLIAHLETHLFDRTLLLFAELLKDADHTPAWRAFQRGLLETLRDQVQAVATEVHGVREDVQALQALQDTLTRVLAQIEDDHSAWTQLLNDLPTSLARIEQQQQAGFRALFQQALAQDAALQQHLDALRAQIDQVVFVVTATHDRVTHIDATTTATQATTTVILEELRALRALFPSLSAPTYRVEGETLLVARRSSRAPLHERQRHLLERHTLFGGRDAELAQIRAFLHTRPGGYLFVTGPSGYGKSALLANLIAADRPRYCWYVLNALDGTHRRGDFLRQLCEQMLTYYQMPPQDDDLPRDADRLEALYIQLLRMPLVRPDQPLILVIDGLDEAEERFVLSDRYLPRTLPAGKFVIMAARATGEDYLARLGLAPDQVQTLTLTTLDTAGIADLLRTAGGAAAAWADDPPRLAEVQRVSQGDPFYLHYLVQDIRDGRIGADDLARQPVGLTGYLDGWWHSVEEHAEQQPVADLLGYLSTAHGPLTRNELITIRPDDALRGRTMDGTLRRVRRFVIGDDQSGYRLCHLRFQAYVDDRMSDETPAYRQALQAYCARWREHQSRYALRHYPAHLFAAQAWPALYALAEDAAFRASQAHAFPTEPDLPLQTIHTALRGAITAEDGGMIATMLLLHARQVAQVRQESPLAVLHDGSRERAQKLADLADPHRRVLWYLLLAWELADSGRGAEATALLDRLRAADLPRLADWQGDLAVAALAALVNTDAAGVADLARRVLDDADRGTICERLATAGAFSLARQTAAAIANEDERAGALRAIAAAQAQAGHVAEAVQTAAAIEREWQRAWALWAIAKAQAEAGQADAARATFAEAVQTAAIAVDWRRARALRAIAAAQARAGQFAEAVQTAAAIEREYERAGALRDIAAAQAQAGQFAEAEQTAAAIERASERAGALRDIAAAQAQAGHIAEAVQTAAAIERASERAEALRAIAVAQPQAGQVDDARATFAEARQTATAIADEGRRAEALEAIAAAQTQAVLYAEAEQTAAAIEDEKERAGALRAIAAAQARAGQFAEAQQTAAAIAVDWRRAEALKAIAAAQAQAGQDDDARATFAEAVQTAAAIAVDWRRAEALKAIAAAQAQAGQDDDARATFAEAVQTAAAIAVDWRRAEALQAIAAAQAQAGQDDAARTTFAEAVQAATAIEWRWGQAKTLGAIAAAQAWAGQDAAARATFADARQTAAAIANEGERAKALKEIAAAQVQAGLYAEAVQTAAALADEGDRARGLRDIAAAQAQAGHVAEAVQTAAAIRVDYEEHLPAIAQALCEVGDRQHLKQVLMLGASDLEAAYALCGVLAQAYPEQAAAVAQVVIAQG